VENDTLSEQQRAEIEAQIKDSKGRLNALMTEQKAANAEKYALKQATLTASTSAQPGMVKSNSSNG